MQTAELTPQPQFVGADDDQKIADEVFRVMCVMGRFFPRIAPIRVTLGSIAEFIASRHPDRTADEWNPELDRILSENPAVFARIERDDAIVFVTTAQGLAPTAKPVSDDSHMLAKRFQEPVPLPERPVEPETRLRTAQPAEAAGDEFDESIIPEQLVTERPAASPAIAYAESRSGSEVVIPAAQAAEQITEEIADIGALGEPELADILTAELRQDLSVANFGDLWMAEDKVPRLSRGELRRIKEYLLERNEPLTDESLVQDVLGNRPSADDYALMRFALNFRLSHEHREFEFVGTPDQRLWSTTGLPSIGTSKRKPSEIGSDYRFLLDYRPANPDRDETVVEHVLTFYEYQFGVLPFDSGFEALFPEPILPDQRAAVVVFESPQTYENLFVELRYPTGNRGGYVAGLERFFAENLVPGALITIERTENNGRYLIEYLPISGQDRKLVQLDEKKGRYVFRPTTFYCATQENMVLTENRFPRLANAAALDERARRRPEETLAATFERIGEREGTGETLRYMAIIDDLVAAANIERPMSVELIRDLVQSPDYPQFSVDPDVEDVFYYQPVTA